MPKKYFSQYKSPNIVIEPTVVFKPPSPKKPKVDNVLGDQSPQHLDISFLDDLNIDEIVAWLKMHEENQHLNMKLETKCKPIKSKTCLIENVEENALSKNALCEKNLNIVDTKDSESSKTETNNKNIKINKNLEKSNNTETNVLAIEDELNSSVSFKFIEHTKAELKNSNIDDSGAYRKIKINVNLVANDSSKITTYTQSEAKLNSVNVSKCEELNNSENTSMVVQNGSNKSIRLKAEPIKINKNKKSSRVKNVVVNETDTLLTNLQKYLLKYLHEKPSVPSIIHNGRFSKIFKSKDSAGNEYAVKMLSFSAYKYSRGLQEQKMLKDIQCDVPKENLFCIYLHQSFLMDGNWCFITDFYPQNLKEVICNSSKPFNIDTVKDLTRQLVSAVTLLRINNIVHSDIKPSHILLNCSNNKLKLCGFDDAYYIESAIISPNHGTFSYRAPEVILGYSAGFCIDVWSTALVLYEMATGKQLFPGYVNGDILYKQMSILGNIPHEMIDMSHFSNHYFIGYTFKKQIGLENKKFLMIHYFAKSNEISKTVYDAYFEHWAPLRTKNQREYDEIKIHSFINLLQQMIVLFPKNRLTIEFVYSNPFINE